MRVQKLRRGSTHFFADDKRLVLLLLSGGMAGGCGGFTSHMQCLDSQGAGSDGQVSKGQFVDLAFAPIQVERRRGILNEDWHRGDLPIQRRVLGPVGRILHDTSASPEPSLSKSNGRRNPTARKQRGAGSFAGPSPDRLQSALRPQRPPRPQFRLPPVACPAAPSTRARPRPAHLQCGWRSEW